MFGDYIVESIEDDIGEAFITADVDPEQCYARIDECEDGFDVEIMRSDDGEAIVATDPIFDSVAAARDWAKGWVKDVESC